MCIMVENRIYYCVYAGRAYYENPNGRLLPPRTAHCVPAPQPTETSGEQETPHD